MNSCASPDALEQFLADSLPEAETKTLREHLAGCARCQALLDRLSDDPELRRWAASWGAVAPQLPSDPGLAHLLDKLRAAPPAITAVAIADGFKDGARLKQDEALAPLRSRDDFQKLLTELEAKPK